MQTSAALRSPARPPACLAAIPHARPVQPPKLHICRARLANVEIPDNKCVRYSLQYIYGVGDTTAQRVLDAVGIDYTKRVYELSEDEMGQIRAELENYTIESDLRRIISMNIKRLIDIQCYRGQRHQENLPVRGQNTKNNARTRKGKKGGPIANKK